jgi:hypothetical protein
LAIILFLIHVLLAALLWLWLLSGLLALLSRLAMLSGLLSGLVALLVFLFHIVRHENPPQKARVNRAFLLNRALIKLVAAKDCAVGNDR